MQPKGWKNFLFAILLTTNGAIQVCANVDKAWAKNSRGESSSIRRPPKNVPSEVTSLTSELIAHQQCQQVQQDASGDQVPELQIPGLAKIDDSLWFVNQHHNILPNKQINITQFSREERERCFDSFSQANRSLQLFSTSEFEASEVSAKCKNYLCQESIGLNVKTICVKNRLA